MKDYSDIIHLPRHISRTHKHMSSLDRAAQFAPFAALSGHEEEIQETARLTDQQIILDETQKEIINQKLQYIDDHLNQKHIVSITYFVKDVHKQGGSYRTISGIIRFIDKIENKIIFKDKRIIMIHDILSIESEIFERNCYEEI